MLKAELFWPFALLAIGMGVVGCILHRPFRYLLFGIMVFSLFFEGLSVTFFFETGYRGTTHGFEIYAADLIAVVLAIDLVRKPRVNHVCWFPRLTIPYFLFLLAAILSWLFTANSLYNPFSQNPIYEISENVFLKPYFNTALYPLFEIAKYLRAYLMFWVTVNMVTDRRAMNTLTFTIAMMLIYAASASLMQRYILGIHRVTVLSDINIFNCFVGMLGAFVAPFAFYYRSLLRSGFYWCAVLGGFLTIILTISRSSLLGFLIALAIVTILMLRRFWTAQNLRSIGAMILVAGVLMLKAAQTLLDRFMTSEDTSSALEGRFIYNSEAFMMGQEHLFGVGINNYSAFSVNEYGLRAGAEPGALAHNLWFLTFAETGLPGLLFFAFYWLCFYFLFVRCWLRESKQRIDLNYTLLTAVFAAIFVMHFHVLFHFSYRYTSILFLSNVIVGLMVRIFMVQRSSKSTQLT
jgi:O-antigen ligase